MTAPPRSRASCARDQPHAPDHLLAAGRPQRLNLSPKPDLAPLPNFHSPTPPTDRFELNHKHGARQEAPNDQGDHLSLSHMLGRSNHRDVPRVQSYRNLRSPHQHLQALPEAMDRVADRDFGLHSAHSVPAVRSEDEQHGCGDGGSEEDVR
jgi:hypothetical protein